MNPPRTDPVPIACAPPAASVAGARAVGAARGRIQLTNRGIAVVLVAGLMVMVASMAVIGLTALRVTGPTYQPYGHTALAD